MILLIQIKQIILQKIYHQIQILIVIQNLLKINKKRKYNSKILFKIN